MGQSAVFPFFKRLVDLLAQSFSLPFAGNFADIRAENDQIARTES
jgi:hypothetical protein